MKKVLSVLLSIVLMLALFPTGIFTITANAATSGTTGDCTWTLDGTVLTIRGDGAMGDYTTFSKLPWGADITEVIIGEGVTNIGSCVFYGCDSLTSITIGNSVTSIGDLAFRGCDGLTSITNGNSVTSIGEGAFFNCDGLTSIAITNNVTSISAEAFFDCDGLTSITIPDSVTSIGFGSFSFSSGLTSITIPDSVTSIGNEAFFRCSNLTDVWYSGSESQRNNISIGSNNTELTNATWHYNTITTYEPGDINGDAEVNVVDLALLKKVVAGLSESLDVDLNGDGNTDVVDLALLKKIVAGLA